jgi:hypothetical protein
MRTAVFLGLIFIAQSIDKEPLSAVNLDFVRLVMYGLAFMDVTEYIKRLGQDKY